MQISEKAQIYRDVWKCAHQRRFLYKGTLREEREHDTVLLSLRIAKWWSFDTEKPKHLK